MPEELTTQFTLTTTLPPEMSKKDKKKEEPKLKVINHPTEDTAKKASKRETAINSLKAQ